MTLPEVCEIHECPENIMPNTNTTSNSSLPNTIPASGLLITKPSTTPTTTPTSNDNHLLLPSPNNVPTTTSLGEALKSLLRQASSQGRVTCSLTACVDLLSTRPEDVMLCVMPVLPHPDAADTIQSTLIRAVCLEHNIRILTVDCEVKLAKTVVGACSGSGIDEALKGAEAAAWKEVVKMEDEEEEEEEEEEDDMMYDVCNNVDKNALVSNEDSLPLYFTGYDNFAPVMGFPCVLIEFSAGGKSQEDEVVAEFCKEQLFGQSQEEPYIELPD